MAIFVTIVSLIYQSQRGNIVCTFDTNAVDPNNVSVTWAKNGVIILEDSNTDGFNQTVEFESKSAYLTAAESEDLVGTFTCMVNDEQKEIILTGEYMIK